MTDRPHLWLDYLRVCREQGHTLRGYGYYCLPVLAGERLIGRVDLKARRAEGKLDVLATHFESTGPGPRDRHALGRALERFSASVGLQLRGSSRIG